MENTQIWKAKGKRRWTPTRSIAQETITSPNSLETHLVGKCFPLFNLSHNLPTCSQVTKLAIAKFANKIRYNLTDRPPDFRRSIDQFTSMGTGQELSTYHLLSKKRQANKTQYKNWNQFVAISNYHIISFLLKSHHYTVHTMSGLT